MDHRLPTVLAGEIGFSGFVFQYGGHGSFPFEPGIHSDEPAGISGGVIVLR
jgi:hypothetical protein